MSLLISTLVPASNLKHRQVDAMAPGTVFFTPPGGGIGMVVLLGDQLRVLALKDVEAEKALAGDVFFPRQEDGVAVENVGVEVELDWRNDFASFQRPKKDDGPAVLISAGEPIILGVYARDHIGDRGWVGFGLDGKRKQLPREGAIAQTWNLVLIFNDRRVPIIVGE